MEEEKTNKELADEAWYLLQGRQFRGRWAYDHATYLQESGEIEKAKESFKDASWELVDAINKFHTLKRCKPDIDEAILGLLEDNLVEIMLTGDLDDPSRFDYNAIKRMGAESYQRVMNAVGKTPSEENQKYLRLLEKNQDK